MHLAKDAVPVKIDVPGATARQITDFGDTAGCGSLAGEYFSLASGTDIAPLLEGLKNDSCHAPHWGYVITGELVVTYTGGDSETCSGGDLFYWPPGHSVRVERDADVILFSPQKEHSEVLDHMIAKMAG
jgi:hypothetical protein